MIFNVIEKHHRTSSTSDPSEIITRNAPRILLIIQCSLSKRTASGVLWAYNDDILHRLTCGETRLQFYRDRIHLWLTDQGWRWKMIKTEGCYTFTPNSLNLCVSRHQWRLTMSSLLQELFTEIRMLQRSNYSLGSGLFSYGHSVFWLAFFSSCINYCPDPRYPQYIAWRGMSG